MLRWKKSIRKLAVNVLDLPEDLVHRVPRLIMTGDMQLSIENHKGVDLFTSELLRLRLDTGKLEIAGRDLSIRNILKDEVQVDGVIERIQFIR